MPGSATPVPQPDGPPPPSRVRRWFKLLFFSFAFMFALLLGALAATTFFTKQKVDKLLTPKTADTRVAQKHLQAALPGKPANVLILGSDHRVGNAENDRRSDTLMLMRLDPQGKTISMLSFPRDLYVDIPGHGTSKINDAYALGGPALTVDTVKELTGLDVNYIVTVDFKGFRGIVDTLGGVYVDVDRRYFNDNSSGYDYAVIDIEPGYQLLMGQDALAFARFRHTDSDFHRIARQQQLLAALKKQVGASAVARNIPGLFRVLYKNTDMAAGGNGKISTRQVIEYIRLAITLKGSDVYQIEVMGGIDTAPNGASIVVADEATIKGAVDAFLDPDEDAREKTADQVTGQKSGAAGDEGAGGKLPPASTVTIEVKNGNGVAGAAGETAVSLRGLGYRVTVQPGEAGNADHLNYANSRVQYRNDADRALAEHIADSVNGATVEKQSSANVTAARILVIVGDGAGVTGEEGPTAEVNRVPEKAPARVVADREYGLDEFLLLRGKTKVPLMYPTVRELNSTYETPVRAYKVAKGREVYDAYRMVAKTGGLDYWGLQGTTWPDPPLLEDPTREMTRGGRTYMLFFNGTKLHMVAWRERGAVYWVSNSVLDKLSNETMLAIAQGVRPVPRR